MRLERRRRVVFLDRDGTLCRDRPGFYLRRPEQLRVYPFAGRALALLRRAGYALVVLSNQSGLGRGFLDRRTLARIHARLRAELARAGAGLDAIYFCPHAPWEKCRCRKPRALLARRAARELKLSLKGAAMIGDKKVDVDLGRSIGIDTVLVRTGHGRSQQARHGAALKPTAVASNLLAAARWVLGRDRAITRGSAASEGRRGAAGRAITRGSAAALAAALLAPAAAGAVAISSRTVNEPYDLVAGSAAPTAELSGTPWFGESLEYEVKWGIFSVGTATLEARRVEDFNGSPAVRIVSSAKSNAFCNRFYPVRDLNESWIDAKAFKSLGYVKRLREGKFFRDEWVVYDYPRKSFLSKRTSRDGSFEYSAGAIPGPVHDILSSMYYVRTHPLKVGDVITLDVNTRENWPLAIKVLRRTSLKVPAGSFPCVVVEPYVREEHLFVQKGRSLKVWLSEDKRRLPVYMAVELFFGDISATLIKIAK